MPVTGSTIRVEGLRELTRAFAIVGGDLPGDLKAGLRTAAEPVKADAERLTQLALRRGRIPWWQMRIGATAIGSYIVPKNRRTRGGPKFRRKSYRTLVLPRMLQAARQNEVAVTRAAQVVVNRAIDRWGRMG